MRVICTRFEREKEKPLFHGGSCNLTVAVWFLWSNTHSPPVETQELIFTRGVAISWQKRAQLLIQILQVFIGILLQGFQSILNTSFSLLPARSKHSSCRTVYVVPGPVADPYLALNSCKTVWLKDNLVNWMEQHTSLWHVLPPESKGSHQPCASLSQPCDRRCWKMKLWLYFTSQGIPQHSPVHWVPRNFTNWQTCKQNKQNVFINLWDVRVICYHSKS